MLHLWFQAIGLLYHRSCPQDLDRRGKASSSSRSEPPSHTSWRAFFCSNVEVSRHTRERAAQMLSISLEHSIRRNRTTWKADFIAFVTVWAGPHSHIRLGGIYGCASVYHSPTSLYTLVPRSSILFNPRFPLSCNALRTLTACVKSVLSNSAASSVVDLLSDFAVCLLQQTSAESF